MEAELVAYMRPCLSVPSDEDLRRLQGVSRTTWVNADTIARAWGTDRVEAQQQLRRMHAAGFVARQILQPGTALYRAPEQLRLVEPEYHEPPHSSCSLLNAPHAAPAVAWGGAGSRSDGETRKFFEAAKGAGYGKVSARYAKRRKHA